MWSILLFARNAVIGTVSVGLVMGACLLAHFLFRLSRLPKACREYRERSYHLESETLLRYVITILCLITLNILFYTFFELGKTCTHIGIVSWTVYLAGGWAKSKLKQVSKWGDIYILICIGICRQKIVDPFRTSYYIHLYTILSMVKLSSYSNGYEDGKFELMPWEFWTE